ncbi:MAG TPA: hypothetical protein VHN79_11635, partial [Lacunisphaera sp.]|nr:hypothetical protein [Lacunisphaera sp.]
DEDTQIQGRNDDQVRFEIHDVAAVAVAAEAAGQVVSGQAVRPAVDPQRRAADRRFIATDGNQRMVFTNDPERASAYHISSGSALMQRAPFWRRPATLQSLAGLAGLAAACTLGGVVVRNRREFRENQVQTRASLLQNIQAALWLTAMALFGLFAMKARDPAVVVYSWPGALMITASACALVAAALNVVTLLALPAIWRGGRRVDSWKQLRKLGFTLTTLIYAALAVVLALWGALSPWGG